MSATAGLFPNSVHTVLVFQHRLLPGSCSVGNKTNGYNWCLVSITSLAADALATTSRISHAHIRRRRCTSLSKRSTEIPTDEFQSLSVTWSESRILSSSPPAGWQHAAPTCNDVGTLRSQEAGSQRKLSRVQLRTCRYGSVNIKQCDWK